MELKRVQVHMLPTEDKSQIWGWRLGLAFMKNPSKPVKGAEGLPYHLYFTTDEEIKEGDWYLDVLKTGFPTVHKCGNSLPFTAPKIIATTDPKLLPRKEYEGLDETAQNQYRIIKGLPQPSQATIKAYCEQGGFDEVDVEYIRDMESMQRNIDTKGKETSWYLKVDPIHNTITTHRIVEKMYSRGEFIQGLVDYTNDFMNMKLKGTTTECVNQWIKENLKQ